MNYHSLIHFFLNGFCVNQQTAFPHHAPVRVIAIAGCDGAGKSTLASCLTQYFSADEPTKLLYLGQSSGHIAEWITHLPLIGAPFGGYLKSKARRIHDKPAIPPGAVTALVIYLLSCWRTYKFCRMLRMCKKGYLLFTDRYPQTEVAGFRFDGPQLAKTEGGSLWVRALRKREEKMYQWMASYPPVLLIRLNIDAETAHQRKPDHPRSVLREKTAVIPQLTFNGAHIVDLNGCDPADKIFHASRQAVQSSLSSSFHRVCDDDEF